jgi:hypothetical protein
MVTQGVGAVTGSVLGTFETASAANGAGNVALVPAGGALVAANASNATQKTWIDSSQCLGWIKYIGTVTTGPILISVTAHFHNKYTG